MGSETKVGLLVGMCFIICFAIILSHRGAPEPTRETPGFEITTAQAEAQKAAEQQAQRGADAAAPTAAPRERISETAARRPVRPPAVEATAPRRYAARNQTEPSGQGEDENRFTRRSAPIPAPQAVNQVARLAHPARPEPDPEPEPGISAEELAIRDHSAQRQPTPSPWIDAGRQVADALANAGYQLASRAQDEQRRRQEELAASESMPVDTTDTAAAPLESKLEQAARPAPAPAPTPAPAREPRMYQVQPGDTLTRIAQTVYGDSSPATIEAIFAANRQRMSSQDQLIVGREIELPDLGRPADVATGEQATSKPAPAPGRSEPELDPAARQLLEDLERLKNPARRGAEGVAEAGGANASDYTVQPGDTLTRIVRRHYHTDDEAVLRKVFEANQDRLRSPDALLVGARIRLPDIGQARPVVEPAPDQESGALAQQKAKAPAPTGNSPKPGQTPADWRWYVVKPGDLLSTVAQAELGSARRWKEIARLNQDILPDPSRVRSGMRIRLPIDGPQTADAATHRGAKR